MCLFSLFSFLVFEAVIYANKDVYKNEFLLFFNRHLK